MTTEEKFHAAVNVIRSLPKNGSYQPSNELMLRFYSYFKQATQGPCKGARPAFWDVVGRAKYDAWKKLGEMSKQKAMDSYVTELHRIVETMSYNDNIANFLEAQTELDQVPIGDLELIAGDVIERVRSQPNSPFASREASPTRLRSSLETSPASSPSASPPPQISNHADTDHSDDEYMETYDVIPFTANRCSQKIWAEPNLRSTTCARWAEPNLRSTICARWAELNLRNTICAQSEPEYYSKKPLTNGFTSEMPNGHTPRERQSRSKTKIQEVRVDISQDVQRTIQSLKDDLERLTLKMTSLEKNCNSQTQQLIKRNKAISFRSVSPTFLAFIVLWPFVCHRLISFWNNRKSI